VNQAALTHEEGVKCSTQDTDLDLLEAPHEHKYKRQRSIRKKFDLQHHSI